MMRLATRTAPLLVALALRADRASAEPATTGGIQFGPHDVASVAFVEKSENRNEVHYAIALDDRCQPASAAPVYAYWRMRERGERAMEPLLEREVRAYGVLSQTVEGSLVRVKLRALATRRVTFEVGSDGGRCTARAVTSIGGRPARLTSVYVKLAFPFRVDHLLVQGLALDDGRPLRERIVP